MKFYEEAKNKATMLKVKNWLDGLIETLDYDNEEMKKDKKFLLLLDLQKEVFEKNLDKFINDPSEYVFFLEKRIEDERVKNRKLIKEGENILISKYANEVLKLKKDLCRAKNNLYVNEEGFLTYQQTDQPFITKGEFIQDKIKVILKQKELSIEDFLKEKHFLRSVEKSIHSHNIFSQNLITMALNTSTTALPIVDARNKLNEIRECVEDRNNYILFYQFLLEDFESAMKPKDEEEK